MFILTTAEVTCPNCGKRHVPKSMGQKYCYDPCVPTNPQWELASRDKVHRDCIMFRTDGRKEWCSGLRGLYCGFGACRFYKQKKEGGR